MVNKPLIRPYFLGGVALGGVARIPLINGSLQRMGFILISYWVLISFRFPKYEFHWIISPSRTCRIEKKKVIWHHLVFSVDGLLEI